MSDELDQLLGLLVDDLIDETGVARLHDLLVGDPAARLRYRRFLAVHSALRWDYAAVARDPREQPARPAQPHWDRWLPLGAVAAALVAALVLAWCWAMRIAHGRKGRVGSNSPAFRHSTRLASWSTSSASAGCQMRVCTKACRWRWERVSWVMNSAGGASDMYVSG